jgi:hypothetical protein
VSTIAIDLNVRIGRDGTYSGFEDADGPLVVGEPVTVIEPESGISGQGRVTHLDADRRLVFLTVDWRGLTGGRQ